MLQLRSARPADLDFVVAIESHPSVASHVAVCTRERHHQAIDDPDEAHWLIVDTESDKPLGFVLLAGLTNPHRGIELRRIVVADKGKGIGRAALRLVKKRVFEELGTHRLWLDVEDFNERARGLYSSEGFVEEGRLRDALVGPEGYEALIVMSMLESEYRASEATGQP